MARKKAEPPSDEEDWIATYADAITLLMAFFVMLVSFSKVELPLFEAVQAGIKEKLGGEVDSDKPIFSLNSKINNIVQDQTKIPPDQIDVGFDDEGVVVDFASGSFFKPGSAELTEAATFVLGKIKRELELPPYDLYHVDVQGHTDDVPIKNSPIFPTNWELSTARAARVVREFADLGLDPKYLQASGYADTRPKVPHRDLLDEPILENQKKNRRVSVRLYPE